MGSEQFEIVCDLLITQSTVWIESLKFFLEIPEQHYTNL